ncbi:hypothetical protein ABRP59_08430 [Pectobacterium punjabense]|uniref:hypothetical protein n=1 Tax=Pectobacterium punjabense TaxID=2108399 RepID=UPI0032ECE10B
MKIGQKITTVSLLPVGSQIKALDKTLTYFYAVRMQAGKILPFIWSSCHILCAKYTTLKNAKEQQYER